MFDQLPSHPRDAYDWAWDDYQPYFEALQNRDLTEKTIADWLADYSKLTALAYEVRARLYTAKAANTADEKAKDRYFAFLDVAEKMSAADNTLNKKLIDSGITPDGFSIPLRQMRSDVDLFREENLPLFTELQKLGNRYDEITGSQSVEWEGETLTVTQARAKLQDQNRATREAIWKLAYERQQQDTEALNALWTQMLEIRLKIAANAGKDTYRDYAWQSSGRFDYTPEDNTQFLESIRKIAVPAMERMAKRRQEMMGLDTLRPWDMAVDPTGMAPLAPFDSADELIAGGRRIFGQLHPELAAYYADMQDNHLLDLDNRSNKAPGGYMTSLPMSEQALIFMNAVGIHDDVQTLLHESGHAFHTYEAYALPYVHQQDYPIEFAEVASMSMELLAAPYLTEEKGGFYSEVDAARARTEHLEGSIYFWCYMAVVDSFQHWAYTHPEDAKIPANCDTTWSQLWDSYLPGVDWSGFEDIKAKGWQRKLHIFHLPFYYLEYGLAQLGAGQIWRNSLEDYDKALADYRHALSLGNTQPLPALFEAAGARLGFDTLTLSSVVDLYERTINELDEAL